MKVGFTKEAEKLRTQQRESSWELLKTTSIVEAVHHARDNGWKENKVQVRTEVFDGIDTYYVEPYEKGCGCKGILKYRHYFD